MSDEKKLDDMEAEAIRMIESFQEECRKHCAPYVKIIADIRALRPKVFVVDGKLMVPFS